jgi:hypothetical protein
LENKARRIDYLNFFLKKKKTLPNAKVIQTKRKMCPLPHCIQASNTASSAGLHGYHSYFLSRSLYQASMQRQPWKTALGS